MRADRGPGRLNLSNWRSRLRFLLWRVGVASPRAHLRKQAWLNRPAFAFAFAYMAGRGMLRQNRHCARPDHHRYTDGFARPPNSWRGNRLRQNTRPTQTAGAVNIRTGLRAMPARPDDILAESHGEVARSSWDRPSLQFIMCASCGLLRNVDVPANNRRSRTDAMLFPVQPSMLE